MLAAATRRVACRDEPSPAEANCRQRDAAMGWVGRGASAPGWHQAACQLLWQVSRRGEVDLVGVPTDQAVEGHTAADASAPRPRAETTSLLPVPDTFQSRRTYLGDE
jgi:hypothetical protein